MSEQKNKFEAMLEKLVADDKQAAEELFHDIVVEKSRQIYENLLEGDLEDAKVDEKAKEESKEDESVEEKTDTSKKEDDAVEEKTDASEKEEDAVEEKADDSEKAEDKVEEVATDEAEIPAELDISQEAHGGDATDDMIGDIEADKGEEDNDSEGEEEIEDRVVDLEDAIDDLKAEFEKMMSDKEEGDDDSDDSEEEKEDEAIADQSAEVAPEQVAAELGDQQTVESEAPKSATEEIREYVNKVSASNTDGSDTSTKSPVAGKNDMGGTTGNIAQGGEETGGKAPAPKEEDAGNVNKPGAKAKMSAAPKAKTNADDDGSANKSTIGS